MDQKVNSVVPETRRGPRRVEGAVEAPCVMGREIHFQGSLNAAEDLTVLGRVEGKINAKGALIIGREAQIDAQVTGQRVMVLGRVKGSIRGTERVELGPSATVVGDISAPVIQIDEGAQFEGRVRRPGRSGGSPFMDKLLRR